MLLPSGSSTGCDLGFGFRRDRRLDAPLEVEGPDVEGPDARPGPVVENLGARSGQGRCSVVAGRPDRLEVRPARSIPREPADVLVRLVDERPRARRGERRRGRSRRSSSLRSARSRTARRPGAPRRGRTLGEQRSFPDEDEIARADVLRGGAHRPRQARGLSRLGQLQPSLAVAQPHANRENASRRAETTAS